MHKDFHILNDCVCRQLVLNTHLLAFVPSLYASPLKGLASSMHPSLDALIHYLYLVEANFIRLV